MPRIVIALLLGSCAVHAFAGQTARPPKPGVKTLGVKIPIERLKPEAVFPYEGNPDWIAVDEAVWVSNTEKSTVTRVDPHTNLIVETIPVGKSPRFIAVGAGAVWAVNQGDGSVSRIDPKTNKVAATIEVGVPGGGGDIAVGEG